MTQIENPYGAEVEGAVTAESPRMSGMSIAALLCSVIFCCPCTTVPGLLLGIIAAIKTSTNPMLRGRGLAIVAIVIALAGTAVQIGGYQWVNENIAKPIETGPDAAFVAGAGGDAAAFKADCYGAAAQASDAEVIAFFQALESRYGAYQSMTLDEVAMGERASEMMGQTAPMYPYDVQFANATVDIDVVAAFVDPVSGEWLGGTKFGTITVRDETLGDLIFPATAAIAETDEADADAPAEAADAPAEGDTAGDASGG